jgi:hypothetical protein
MQLEQLENSLPNGFHDSLLEAVEIDYVSRKVLMKMQLCIGNPDASVEAEREGYRPAELLLSDFLYFIIDPPHLDYKYAEQKALRLHAGRADEESAPAPPIPLQRLPSGASAYWFFVSDWNSFIHVAAMSVGLQWK